MLLLFLFNLCFIVKNLFLAQSILHREWPQVLLRFYEGFVDAIFLVRASVIIDSLDDLGLGFEGHCKLVLLEIIKPAQDLINSWEVCFTKHIRVLSRLFLIERALFLQEPI